MSDMKERLEWLLFTSILILGFVDFNAITIFAVYQNYHLIGHPFWIGWNIGFGIIWLCFLYIFRDVELNLNKLRRSEKPIRVQVEELQGKTEKWEKAFAEHQRHVEVYNAILVDDVEAKIDAAVKVEETRLALKALEKKRYHLAEDDLKKMLKKHGYVIDAVVAVGANNNQR